MESRRSPTVVYVYADAALISAETEEEFVLDFNSCQYDEHELYSGALGESGGKEKKKKIWMAD